jgi:hypothetical protein
MRTCVPLRQASRKLGKDCCLRALKGPARKRDLWQAGIRMTRPPSPLGRDPSSASTSRGRLTKALDRWAVRHTPPPRGAATSPGISFQFGPVPERLVVAARWEFCPACKASLIAYHPGIPRCLRSAVPVAYSRNQRRRVGGVRFSPSRSSRWPGVKLLCRVCGFVNRRSAHGKRSSKSNVIAGIDQAICVSSMRLDQ